MSMKSKGVTRALVLKANEAMLRAPKGTSVEAKSLRVQRRVRLTGREINSAYAAAVKALNTA